MNPGVRLPAGAVLVLLAAACTAASAPPLDFEPSTLERHTVDSDGHPMAVWEQSLERPVATVLLLHGRTWSTVPDFDLEVEGEDLSLMNGLNRFGVRTFGLDARGYGETPRDETGWLTPDRAAADVIHVLEWIAGRDRSAPPPVLFGWSNGSMVAQLTVQRRPDLVSGVVLFGYPFDVGTEVQPQAAPAEPPRRPTTAEAAASDFLVEGAISQRAIDAFVGAALAADPIRVDWKNLEQWNELDPAAVTVPTLLIEGEFDPLTDVEVHTRLFTGLGTADRTWTVVAGGDHAVYLEAPRDTFLDIVADFIERVSPG